MHFRDEDKKSISAKVIEEINKWMERFDCLVIGPGLGRDPFLLVRVYLYILFIFIFLEEYFIRWQGNAGVWLIKMLDRIFFLLYICV